MVKRVIINSDDFGITEGVTIGTLHSHTDGVLTSTTCMMNMPFAEFALNLAKDYPDLGVGIHLVFTMGRPLIEGAKSFTDADGNFRKLNTYTFDEASKRVITEADPDELYAEWKAQLERFIAVAGKKPTHIDSHHHSHTFVNNIEVAMRLAEEYDLPIRQTEPFMDHYEFIPMVGSFYGDELTNDSLIDLMKNSDAHTIEIMCHPGYVDQRILDLSKYNLPRAKEMEILRSDEVKQFVKDNGIELVTYAVAKKK